MINIYELENYEYLCIHQNCLLKFLQNDMPFVGYPRSGINLIHPYSIGSIGIQEIVFQLEKDRAKKALLIIDMRNMIYSPTHEIDSLFNLLTPELYKGICFIQDNDELNKLVESKILAWKKQNNALVLCELEKSAVNNCWYCGNEDTLNELKEHVHSQIFCSVIDNDIHRFIFQWIRTDVSGIMSKNFSSNVYTNRYFDAKKILVDGGLFNLVTYRMAIMIQQSMKVFREKRKQEQEQKPGQEHVQDQEERGEPFDAFVCASLTGACLAAGLSAMFHKPVIYLKNVGPSIMVNDERMIARIRKDKRYIFVFDFMCMGKEFERIKMICNLRSAVIVGCAGISYYRLPRFEKADEKQKTPHLCFDINYHLKLAALFHVNAFEQGYYYCNVEERKL